MNGICHKCQAQTREDPRSFILVPYFNAEGTSAVVSELSALKIPLCAQAMVEPVLKLNHHLLGDFKPGPALTFGVLDTPMACTRFVSDLDNWDDG